MIRGLHLVFSHIKGDEENSHHDQSQSQRRSREKIMQSREGMGFCDPGAYLRFFFENRGHSLEKIHWLPGPLLQIEVHEELIDKYHHSGEDAA